MTTTAITPIPEPEKTPSATAPVQTAMPIPTSTAAQSASAGIPTPQASVNREVKTEDTVAGNMSALMNENSDYMKINQAQAQRAMHARGMDDSSVGVGAVREAAITSALPIAQQDANTYSQASQSNTDTQNSFINSENDYKRARSTLDDQQSHASELQDDSQQHQKETMNLDNDLKKDYATHNSEIDISMLDKQQQHEFGVLELQMDQYRDKKMLDLDASLRQDYMNNATALREMSMQQVMAIYANPELTAEQQKAGVAEITAMSNSSQEWLAESMTSLNNLEIDLGDIDLSGIIMAGDSSVNGGSLAAAEDALSPSEDGGNPSGGQSGQVEVLEKRLELQSSMMDKRLEIDTLESSKVSVPAKRIGKGAGASNKKRAAALAKNNAIDAQIQAKRDEITALQNQVSGGRE